MARQLADHGRSAIWVATDLLEGSSSPGASDERTGMTTREVVVPNRLGLHARAAAKFVHAGDALSRRGSCVRRDSRTMDGKSIMGVLLLAAARGTTIAISADGPDEVEAVAALAALVESGFGEAAVERLTGIGVSPGVAVGRAVVLDPTRRGDPVSGATRARRTRSRRHRSGTRTVAATARRHSRAASPTDQRAISRRSSTPSC